jgi:ketosteroid isomerase-like protein
MSEENVEIVRRVIDAWNRRDIEDLHALTDPEAEYVNSPTAIEPVLGVAGTKPPQ